MINLLGRKKIGSKLAKVQNVFNDHFVNFLYEDCKKQIKFNLGSSIIFSGKENTDKPSLFEDSDILISNCIIDCHGLRICEDEKIKNDLVFPYSNRNWNIFCIKMQNVMFEYCDKIGVDKSQLAPHSCWVERSSVSKYKLRSKIINLIDDTDEWLNTWLNTDNIPHYRILYFLKTPDSKKYGLGVEYKNSIVTLPAEENSLYIIPTINSKYYTQYSTNSDETIIIMFDWYLHPKDSDHLPAWKLPNIHNYKFFERYIQHSIEHKSVQHKLQKILYKHYLKLFKGQLEKTLASRK